MTYSLLLDTYSLMYRAFFALPSSISDADGTPVNAVHGYLDMTARLITARKPDRLIHVFDDAIRPEPRVRAYPQYKAGRAPDPEALPPQFRLLDQVLDALGAERAAAPGWEADDAIAALCARAGRGQRVDVVTGDRDLLSLVRDNSPTVRVLFTVKGVSELAVYDEAAVEAKFGIPPERYTLFAMLRGDPSDGLPGVPGVGEKTAAKLAAQYDSLEQLLESTGSLPVRLGERVRTAAPYLQAMQAVVPARRDVEVVIRPGTYNEAEVAAIAEHGLRGPIGRVRAAASMSTQPG